LDNNSNNRDNKTNGINGNRWSYFDRTDARQFILVMYVVSLAVLLQFFIFEFLPGIIYKFMYNFVVLYTDIPNSDFVYSYPADEINYIFSNILIIIISVLASLITGAFIIFFLRRLVGKSENYDRDRISWKFKMPKNAAALIAIGLCLVQISMYLYSVFNGMLESLFNIAPNPAFTEDAYFPQSVFGIILYFVTIVLTPAFTEEFLFRYLMLNSLKKYGNAFAIVVTAIFFGFAHARTSAFIYATAIGLFTAYFAIKTKSIWFSVILHAVVNATSFALQYLASLSFFKDATLDLIYFAFLTVISAISCIYLIILLIRHKETSLDESRNYINIRNKHKLIYFFNAATVIFFILVIMKSAEEYVFLYV